MDCRYFGTTRNGSHSSYLTPTVEERVGDAEACSSWLVGDAAFHLKSAIRVTHPRKTPTWTDFRSTIRDSEISSIMTNRKSTMGLFNEL